MATLQDYGSEWHNAAARGDIPMLEKLLKKGKFKIDDKAGMKEQTALHVAAYEGKFDTCYWLCENKANVNCADREKWLPLHCAAVNQHLEICSLLLTRGSQVNAVNEQQTAPLHYIIRGQYSEALLQTLDEMLEHKVNLEVRNKFGETPLFQAASKGMTESVRYLLDHHADVNTANMYNQTPLHVAVENGNVATVVLLLKNGASVSAQAEKFGTPLDIAKKENKQEIIEILEKLDFQGRSTYTAFQNPSTEANLFVRAENTKFLAKIDDEHTKAELNSSVSSSSSLNVTNTPVDLVKSRSSTGDLRGSLVVTSLGAEKLTPILLPYPGFRIEHGKDNANKDRQLLFQPLNYSNWFYHSEHYNFVGRVNKKGSQDQYEPLLVSALVETNMLRLNILSRNGDRQEFQPLDPKSKLLKEPSSLKKGLPKETIEFIKSRILLQRPKDTVVKVDLEYANEAQLKESLVEFEVKDPLRPKVFSVGVLYAKETQTNEADMFANEHGSPAFNEFLEFLGDKIPLKGWKGYRGDLDLRNGTTGEFSEYRRWKGIELMFHVSTLLPFHQGQEQQLARKRRIGNDIGVIVFQDGGAYTPPIRSQFLHVYWIVSPVVGKDNQTEYRLAVATNDTVPEYGPQVPLGTFAKSHEFRDFLLTKVVNGLLSALQSPGLRERLWAKPKEAYLVELVKKYCKDKKLVGSLKAPEAFS